jgi:hypothetical protein
MENEREIISLYKQMHNNDNNNVSQTNKKNSHTLNIGDYVRISWAERTSKFNRGFNIQNTEEIFKIRDIDRNHRPAVYHIQSLDDERIDGMFYKQELVRVTLPDAFPIIIKRSRVRDGKKQYYVSWAGYSPSYNQWIDAGDIS